MTSRPRQQRPHRRANWWRRKADNIIASGADFVVLANPGCEFQIAAELRRRGSPIKAVHIADFLAISGRRSNS